MQTPTPGTWTSQDAWPKTSGITLVQTVTGSTNTHPIAVQQKEGKQEAFAAVKNIINNQNTALIDSNGDQAEVGATAASSQNVIDSNNGQKTDTNGLGLSRLIYQVLWCVVISLPTLVLQSTQDLGTLAHCYFITYLHLLP